ncbi:MAG: hypothetical protein ABIF19_11285 [Planctomycetota bacterium]
MLTFSCLQEIDRLGAELTEPAVSALDSVPTQQPPGILWLIHLARGDLSG